LRATSSYKFRQIFAESRTVKFFFKAQTQHILPIFLDCQEQYFSLARIFFYMTQYFFAMTQYVK